MLSTNYEQCWALVDCNNFFASCERIFRPDLINKAIVVLSSNDGCVIARSNEAKALGIKMGEPEFKIRHIINQNKVTVFSTNFKLYGDISSRVMTCLESISPNVQRYSIDEAFIFIDEVASLQTSEYIEQIKKQVFQWTGINVSIGVAKTKTLAKVACKIAKDTSGLYILPDDPKERELILNKFPVEDVWGIGRSIAPKLKRLGIFFAGDLIKRSDEWIKDTLNITGYRTVLELRSQACIENEHINLTRKTLICSRSFGTKVSSKEDLGEALSTFITKACEKLRKEKLVASSLSIQIRTSYFGQTNFKNIHKQVNLPFASDDTLLFIKQALLLLDRIYEDGYLYAKAGVMFLDLQKKNKIQNSLLFLENIEQNKSREKLLHSIDAINKKFGRNTIQVASNGSKDAVWHVQSNKMSANVTTNWNELAIANCK